MPNCPQCENVVSEHAPGVSYTIINGEHYHPGCAPRTWTEYVQTCTCCHERYRPSQEAIDEMREGYGLPLTMADDATIAAMFEFCIQCVDGVVFPGEKAGLN